jgi:hypothetical protein
MVQMPTASSESAPVRLSLFLSSLFFFFFLLFALLLLYRCACNRAWGFVFFLVLFGEKESPRNEIFVLPRAGGFPFFSLSLSLSLFAEAFWARAFGALLLLRRRRRLWRSFWCNAD